MVQCPPPRTSCNSTRPGRAGRWRTRGTQRTPSAACRGYTRPYRHMARSCSDLGHAHTFSAHPRTTGSVSAEFCACKEHCRRRYCTTASSCREGRRLSRRTDDTSTLRCRGRRAVAWPEQCCCAVGAHLSTGDSHGSVGHAHTSRRKKSSSTVIGRVGTTTSHRTRRSTGGDDRVRRCRLPSNPDNCIAPGHGCTTMYRWSRIHRPGATNCGHSERCVGK